MYFIPSATISVLKVDQLVTYFNLASLAMLVFDYFLTIELEIKYIWGSRWSIPTAMFFFTRYLPFVDFIVLLCRTFCAGLSVQTCSKIYRINTVLVLVGFIVAELLLSLRTWAVWVRSKVVGIFLIIFSLAGIIPAISTIMLFLKTVTFIDVPYKQFQGCFLRSGSRVLSLPWIILMIYDGVLLILMVDKAYQSLAFENSFLELFDKSPNSGELLKAIVKDGILYYFYLFVFSLLNVVVIWTMPPDYVNLLTMISRVLHSVLTCRVILHIKDNATIELERISDLETIQFTTRNT